MIKRFLTLAASAVAAIGAFGQNVQIHYDLGNALYKSLDTRQNVTTTIEMFKGDKWGSNYFFIDLDYASDGMKGAYWEISRELNISQNKQFAAHIEYDGGLTSGRNESSYWANLFRHAVLLGPAWNWHNSDYSHTFSLQAMYKYYFKNSQTGAKAYNGFQLTGVWGLSFAKGFCTFSGFADLWYDPDVSGKLILLSEPQFWVNLNKVKGWDGVNLSLGTEVEISNNFIFPDSGKMTFYAIPTVAAKWTF